MIPLCARVASRRAGEALRALALGLLVIPLFCLPRYCHDTANRSTIGDNPDSIQACRTLTIPDLSVAPPPVQSYVTTDADTLWDIAVRFYGDGAQWPSIYEANTAVIGADPNVLTGGLRLQIPAQ